MVATESTGPEAPAIRALGPLFKVTEVFLWDDAMVSFSETSIRRDALEEEPTGSCTTADVNSSIKYNIDDFTCVEDLELAQQMDALGLPSSFSTTKEKKNVANGGKRKGMRAKSISADKDIENIVPGVSIVGQCEDIALTRVLHNSTNIPACGKTAGEIEASHDDGEEEHGRGDVHSDVATISVAVTLLSEIGKRQVADGIPDVLTNNYVDKEFTPDDTDSKRNARVLEHSVLVSLNAEDFPENSLEDEGELYLLQDQDKYMEGSSISCHITGAKSDDDGVKTFHPCPSSMESSLSCPSSMESSLSFELVDHHVQDYPDNSMCCDFGDWSVIWDPFYMRNYFYNFLSEESTWYPPPGLEHFVSSCSISNSTEMFADAAEENAGIGFPCSAIQDKDLHVLQDKANVPQENENVFPYLEQSSQEISSRMNTGLTAIFGSEHSDEHAIDKKITDEKISLHSSYVKDHTTDEMDVSGNLDKHENNLTYYESWSVPDVPPKHPMSNSLSSSLNEVVYEENRSNFPETCVTSTMDELDSYHEIATEKKKKRVRRLQSHLTLQGEIGGLSPNIVKYWCQRYLLFSQFDNGIKMDEEGWFSVTPEPIARHHASRCGSGTVIDCFTGVGGNAIQFAVRSNHVIAIDIDPQKIDYAQHNAAIYGVHDRIDFIKGDFFQIAPRLKGDVVFMSPPWGGPDYVKVQTYDIRSMLKPRDGYYLFKIARMIAPKVVMFLPRNIDLNQLAELSLLVNPPWALEVEKSFLNGRLKAITAYFERSTM